jgi:enoyl-CoA hydratase/carnithine racemase
MSSEAPAQQLNDIAVDVRSGGVAVVEICRPPNNFFDASLIEDLAGIVHALEERGDVRSVVLASRGKHFCAGADFAGTSGAAEVSPDEGARALYRAAVQHLPEAALAADVIERLALARSAALLGSAYGAYELTRRYVTEREQFGAPLIKIPAVAAAVAQMSVRIRTTQSAVDRAVALCTDPDAAPLRRFGAVASARITAAGMATHLARTAHQLHGAVGVTREYGLHRHTRKLWAWRDADAAERTWSSQLGATVLSVNEGTLWDQISA